MSDNKQTVFWYFFVLVIMFGWWVRITTGVGMIGIVLGVWLLDGRRRWVELFGDPLASLVDMGGCRLLLRASGSRRNGANFLTGVSIHF